MLLKLDENLGRSHVELLRNAGHEADRVYDEGLSGQTMRPYGNESVPRDASLSRSISTLRMFAGTRPGLTTASFFCAHAVEAVPPFFRSCNEF